MYKAFVVLYGKPYIVTGGLNVTDVAELAIIRIKNFGHGALYCVKLNIIAPEFETLILVSTIPKPENDVPTLARLISPPGDIV